MKLVATADGPLVEKCGRWILFSHRELDWADRFFARWGYLCSVLSDACCQLASERSSHCLPGSPECPGVRFHVYTFLGSWPWCFALAYFGMKLGENWRYSLAKYFHKLDTVILRRPGRWHRLVRLDSLAKSHVKRPHEGFFQSM